MDFVIYIQSYSSPFLDAFFQLITMMGEDLFFMLVLGIVFWTIDKKFGYRLAFVYLTNGVLSQGLKEIFKVPRIIGQEGVRSLRVETAGGYSFPSGHSQNAASFWTIMMWKVREKWFYIIATVLMLLVAFSRLYLGVHRPVDVIFGLLIGFTWVFIANTLFDYLEKNDIKTTVIISVIVIIALFFVRTETFYKVSGTVISLLLGYIIEKRYIKYTTKAVLLKQVLKLLIGFIGLLIFKEGLKMILPPALWSESLRYFILGLWLTVGGPFIFNKI